MNLQHLQALLLRRLLHPIPHRNNSRHKLPLSLQVLCSGGPKKAPNRRRPTPRRSRRRKQCQQRASCRNQSQNKNLRIRLGNSPRRHMFLGRPLAPLQTKQLLVQAKILNRNHQPLEDLRANTGFKYDYSMAGPSDQASRRHRPSAGTCGPGLTRKWSTTTDLTT